MHPSYKTYLLISQVTEENMFALDRSEIGPNHSVIVLDSMFLSVHQESWHVCLNVFLYTHDTTVIG